MIVEGESLKQLSWTGERAQLVKCLLNMHEDQIYFIHAEKPGVAASGGGDRKMTVAHWPSQSSHLVTPSLVRDHASKNKKKEKKKMKAIEDV